MHSGPALAAVIMVSGIMLYFIRLLKETYIVFGVPPVSQR